VVRAAARGTATRCGQPRGHHDVARAAARTPRRDVCSIEGHHNMAHAVTKAQRHVQRARITATRRVRVQGHGEVGHVLSCPCHASLPLSPSVMGPGGPSRERAAVYVGKEGDLAAKEEVSKEKKTKEKREIIPVA
jgi:hypothetical protein